MVKRLEIELPDTGLKLDVFTLDAEQEGDLSSLETRSTHREWRWRRHPKAPPA